MFEKRGLVVFEKNSVEEEKLLDLALEAGAEDIKESETQFEILTDPADFESIKKVFDDEGLTYSLAEISMIPQNTVKLDGRDAERVLNLLEALEENDDVSQVYANFDIPDEVMEALS